MDYDKFEDYVKEKVELIRPHLKLTDEALRILITTSIAADENMSNEYSDFLESRRRLKSCEEYQELLDELSFFIERDIISRFGKHICDMYYGENGELKHNSQYAPVNDWKNWGQSTGE